MATKEVELRIPIKASDLRIKHFKVLNEPLDELPNDIVGQIQLIHLFTGVRPSIIRMYHPREVDKMFYSINAVFSKMKINNTPPKEVTLNGKVYELIDPDKVGTAWHIDFSKCNITEDPVRLACLFYFPKGAVYGASNDQNVLENPIRDRYEDFQEHLPLSTFIEASAFFLRKCEQSMRFSMEKEVMKNKTINLLKKLRLMNGNL